MSAAPTVVRAGVLGLGFMGRTHARAYLAAARDGLPCTLAAVADPRPDVLAAGTPRGNLEPDGASTLDPAAVAFLPDARSLAARADIDLVSICTPTETHVDLAVMLLEAGKHVLVEKPVATSSPAVARLARAAEHAGRRCVPAMCVRYWPGWDWLRERVRDGSLGAVRAASFTRIGSRPGWAREFYHDPMRTGGALFDLHVHDADIVAWIFGAPARVLSAGRIDHLTTLYDIPAGPPLVRATGGWVEPGGFPFRMRYTAEFEHAVADFDLARDQPLLLVDDRGAAPVPLPAHTGYDGEIRAVVRALTGTPAGPLPSLAECLAVTRVLEAEQRSLRMRSWETVQTS